MYTCRAGFVGLIGVIADCSLVLPQVILITIAALNWQSVCGFSIALMHKKS